MATVVVRGFRSEKDLKKNIRENSKFIGYAFTPNQLKELINRGATEPEFNCLQYLLNDKPLPGMEEAYRAVGADIIYDDPGLIITDQDYSII